MVNIGAIMVKLEVIIKDADYGEIIYKILPQILANMKDKEDAGKIVQILGGMSNVPGTLAKAALAVLPQEVKDELLVKILDGYREELKQKINELLKDEMLPCEIHDIWASQA